MDLLFVHIGKTAGTSIKMHCRKASKFSFIQTGHLTAKELKTLLGKKRFDDGLKFSVVRDPVERFRSACRQCRLDANAESTKDLIETRDYTSYKILRPQVETLYIDGVLSVNKVFKFEEDIPDNFVNWLNNYSPTRGTLLNIDRTRNRKGGKQELTPETERWVRDFYAADFAEFGYGHTTEIK